MWNSTYANGKTWEHSSTHLALGDLVSPLHEIDNGLETSRLVFAKSRGPQTSWLASCLSTEAPFCSTMGNHKAQNWDQTDHSLGHHTILTLTCPLWRASIVSVGKYEGCELHRRARARKGLLTTQSDTGFPVPGIDFLIRIKQLIRQPIIDQEGSIRVQQLSSFNQSPVQCFAPSAQRVVRLFGIACGPSPSSPDCLGLA